VASGYSANGSGDTTLLAQLKGTAWSVVASGGIAGDEAAGLNGVACTSMTFCVAAGAAPDGYGQDDALIEQD